MNTEQIREQTQMWVEEFVAGLNLCPFAPPVLSRVRYRVSEAQQERQLLEELQKEMEFLAKTPAEEVETTLLVHPLLLHDFLDYWDFVGVAEAALVAGGWEGVLQIATFHPNYYFAETPEDAAENYTNRSPYPMLHLLREDSLSHALENYPQPERIPERNAEKMREVGKERLKQWQQELKNT